jgi:hypothetical protein
MFVQRPKGQKLRMKIFFFEIGQYGSRKNSCFCIDSKNTYLSDKMNLKHLYR